MFSVVACQNFTISPPSTMRLEPSLDIAFLSERGAYLNPRKSAIVLMNDAGGNETLFLPAESAISWYPLIWSFDGDTLMYSMWFDKTAQKQYGVSYGLVTMHEQGAQRFIPGGISGSWLQDKDTVLYLVSNDYDSGAIKKISLETGTTTNLLAVTGRPNFESGLRFDWSPHNNRVIFELYTIETQDWGIYTMNSDGTDLKFLLSGRHPDVSPVHPEIVYVHNETLYLADLDGSNIRQFPINLRECEWPSWSPDGERFVFQATVANNSDIYLVNRDGTGLKRLTDYEGYDSKPSWRPPAIQ